MARMSLGGSSSSGGSPPGFPGSHGLGSSTPSPSGPSEPTRRQRSVYSSSQIAQLEAYFGCNEYIDGDRKRQLSILTKIPEQQIKVWFQNRRQKKKRELEEQQQMGHPSGGGGGGGRHHHRGSGGVGEPDFKIQLGPRRNEDHHSEGALPLLPPPPEDEEYSDDEGEKPLQIDQNR